LLLSIVARPREDGLIPGELIPYAFVRLDPGIIPCCKTQN
jgi:hypothetical protein